MAVTVSAVLQITSFWLAPAIIEQLIVTFMHISSDSEHTFDAGTWFSVRLAYVVEVPVVSVTNPTQQLPAHIVNAIKIDNNILI